MLVYWALDATQDSSGTLLTSRRAAGLIIATATLIQLATHDAIKVTTSRITVPEASHAPGAAATTTVPPRDITAPIPAADGGMGWLGADILEQIRQDPTLDTAEVIEALAADIRERLARQLIRTGTAEKAARRWWQPRTVVALLRGQPAGRSPMVKLVCRQPLTSEERSLLHVIATSTLGPIVLGHIRETTVQAGLGAIDALDERHQLLTATAITLLRDMALAR